MRELSGIWTRLMEVAQTIAEHSDGNIKMVFGEHDSLEIPNPKAMHFLKIGGIRFGRTYKGLPRDIEDYGMEADKYGWQKALSSFVDEMIVPLVNLGFDESCKEAVRKIQPLAHEIYPPEQHYNWDEFFRAYL